MLKKLLILTILVLIETTFCEPSGKLFVLESPNYLKYENNEPLKLSDFKNLLLATSGFPIDKPVEWNGLKKEKATDFPRATILFLSNNNLTDDLKTDFIQIKEDADTNFDFLTQSIKNTDSIVKFYSGIPSENELDCSNMNSFHIVQLHDSISQIKDLSKKFSQKCSNDLVSYFLYSNVPIRTKRQTSSKAENLESKVTNEAIFYSDQYPAMFNLIFWSSLILGLAVFGISYGMWNMDPGLNTVIYRMTSQRIKKDQ